MVDVIKTQFEYLPVRKKAQQLKISSSSHPLQVNYDHSVRLVIVQVTIQSMG